MEKRNKNGLTEKEFLEQYNPGDYERPSVTVDMMVLRMRDDLECLQILLIQRGDHPYIGCWALPGGFVGIDESTYTAACRELEEETGLKAKVLDENIYSIQTAPVKGHIKKGKYVSAHLHFDVLYLMEADDTIPLAYKDDESKGVKWVDFDEATDKTMCDFIRPIHKKIIDKLKANKE